MFPFHVPNEYIKAADEIIILFYKMTKNNAHEDEIRKDIYWYLSRGMTDCLFENTYIVTGSKAAKQIKLDSLKIQKKADELLKLIYCSRAGELITGNPNSKIFKQNCTNALQVLSSSAKDQAETLTSTKGRNKSIEREARISLVSALAKLANKAGTYTGTGQTGTFPDFIRAVYEILSITQFNLSTDITDAQKP